MEKLHPFKYKEVYMENTKQKRTFKESVKATGSKMIAATSSLFASIIVFTSEALIDITML